VKEGPRPEASAATAAAAAPAPAPTPPPPAPAASAEPPFSAVDVVVGKGPEAKAGDTVKVHYTGTLTNGTEFDSSRPRGQPFEFVLGKGKVIPGWDKGVAGMKVGGKRKLTIPSALGYGARGAGGKIPPNSTLLFDVELVEIGK
jgi:FKBP-type peptidyl-prolyl cis-trans isomerase